MSIFRMCGLHKNVRCYSKECLEGTCVALRNKLRELSISRKGKEDVNSFLPTTTTSSTTQEIWCPVTFKHCTDTRCTWANCQKEALEEMRTGKNYTNPKPFVCHTGLTGLMRIGKCLLFVGNERAANWTVYVKEKDEVLSLPVECHIDLIGEGSTDHEFVVKFTERAKDLFRSELQVKAQNNPIVMVNWPDFGVPGQLDRNWWDAFVQDLKEIDGNVVMFCQGGHGRTGTAACILGVLAGQVPVGEDPVQWVRENYCQSAVETWEQIFYIEKITGTKSYAQPSGYSWGTKYEYVDTPDGRKRVEKADKKVKTLWVTPKKAKGEKEKALGKSVTGKKNSIVIDPQGVPVLSNNAFKRRTKALRAKAEGSTNMIYKLYPDIGGLMDGWSCVADGELFQWSSKENRFAWVGTPTEADKAERISI